MKSSFHTASATSASALGFLLMIILLRLVNGGLRCDVFDATLPLPDGTLLVAFTEPSAEEQVLLEKLLADVYRVQVPWSELFSVNLVLSTAQGKKEYVFADTFRLTSLVELEFLLEAQVAVFLSSRLLVTVFSSTSALGHHAFLEPSQLMKPLSMRLQLRGALEFIDVLEEAFMLMARLCEQTARAHSRAIAQITESALLSSRNGVRNKHLAPLLHSVCFCGQLGLNIGLSISSLSRAIDFFRKHLSNGVLAPVEYLHVPKTDVDQLADALQANFHNLNLLQATTLGLVNSQQNEVVKLFAVLSVIMMPPTLIASIYGMNFDFMPELSQRWGYPYALGLMIVAATLPLIFCKVKGWL